MVILISCSNHHCLWLSVCGCGRTFGLGKEEHSLTKGVKKSWSRSFNELQNIQWCTAVHTVHTIHIYYKHLPPSILHMRSCFVFFVWYVRVVAVTNYCWRRAKLNACCTRRIISCTCASLDRSIAYRSMPKRDFSRETRAEVQSGMEDEDPTFDAGADDEVANEVAFGALDVVTGRRNEQNCCCACCNWWPGNAGRSGPWLWGKEGWGSWEGGIPVTPDEWSEDEEDGDQ